MNTYYSQGLLLVGPVGSGKTTLLLELGRRLEAQGVPYALVDLDWLAWVSPPAGSPSVHEVLLENLAAVAGTFARVGVERLVLARRLAGRAEVDSIRAAAGVPLVTVELAAPVEVRERRIRSRDTGRELADHLAELAAGTGAGIGEVVVQSGDRPVGDIADDVLDVAGWSV
jgi:GTPase SAR1 family protein